MVPETTNDSACALARRPGFTVTEPARLVQDSTVTQPSGLAVECEPCWVVATGACEAKADPPTAAAPARIVLVVATVRAMRRAMEMFMVFPFGWWPTRCRPASILLKPGPLIDGVRMPPPV